jgi:hypothetical protein
MPFDSQKEPEPKRPRRGRSVFVWPGAAYFLIAVLVGAIVARLLHLWEYGGLLGYIRF